MIVDPATRKAWRKTTRWLARARWCARVFAGRPDFKRPPRVEAEAVDQPSPRRLRERDGLRDEYPLVGGADALGLATSWRHQTVTKERRPGREDYPYTTTLPKFCLWMALTNDLKPTEATWSSVEELESIYERIGMPAMRDAWRTDADALFAEMRVAGPNPMFLQRYATGADVPGLEAPVPDGCYAVAYDHLFGELRGVSPEDRRFFAPGIAVFTLAGERLTPFGIQLRRDDGSAGWFPADGTPAWRLAMMHFNSCDMLAHELIAHFLWTHVVAEKVLLATARNLTWRHPIRRLLAPHLASTLNNNNNATPILIQRGGLFDQVFGAGERGKLIGLYAGEQAWSFEKMCPRAHIRARGLEDLPYYPYRDAAYALWDVVEEMVTDYVATWYVSEDHVVRDEELQRWADELGGFMGPTLPAVRDRASLQRVLTAAIFNVLQHGFVNLLQYDALGYPPLYPVNVRVPVPADGETVTEQTLVDALPTVHETLCTVRATFGFSIQYGRLGTHLKQFHRGRSAQSKQSMRIITRFAARLDALTKTAPAHYRPANPAHVGNSVDA